VYIDGIPLDLASALLPKRSYLSLAMTSHIHLHAKNQQKYASAHKTRLASFSGVSKTALLGIVDSLETAMQGLSYREKDTEWGTYYSFTNYSEAAFRRKKNVVRKYLRLAKPRVVWDLGANNGEFSRIASDQGTFTVSSDLDPVAVEQNYQYMKSSASY
jgi:hypothetical protein